MGKNIQTDVISPEAMQYFKWEHENMVMVAKMSVVGDYTLDLTFANGVQKTINLRPFLFDEHTPKYYWPLRDLNFFRKVYLDNGHVTFPDGRDFHPPLLYTWQGDSWRAWLDQEANEA